ncbi:hypothetical protein A3C09_01320 [Candidatus Uhrbacteria bacterium RIFCSPHIGHO2_02_FULL_47_44]|uniref:Type II toxin-antitoxin system HicA family toxin n=1 Tax=Candidatus Uhrbacteria bacterium RIFCSPLOWO2_02_FULL_48_18 TaxID=1802408 RepID=A0A1F7V8X7_9BACT|nr:MAG: hypothetical protein A2839_00010 [Candidatus Uhrbacteria bacterium RIFCSPHIGHO2_01_FULL_47_10]OGL69806.1 MAG: hypothetical protein A3C09_01320 [Candidatus Uhrbacteria bacterium RIFCSPHIGHO2_02_FULL_47_44]OGL77426.1 MAG: hypothetical protein A3E97_00370 [Candidatus Uhrbacteria bacterium RIFCSPHIGHO2_12_FULL_47_12]OGL81787.1 MAG: hypothetical protein A3B20_01685 [Candidatus Uhrbacteria bacterium RIFCSPLOWO2_01_FULL_47_17]OGL86950.1 MAG: hypothetical protein A3I41_03275 [Candidatus Uhrbact
MGEYADVKRKKILRMLEWLKTQSGFSVDNGGDHQWVIRHIAWKRPFPISFKHEVMNKFILKELVGKIVATGVCTKEQFDEHLK